MTNSKEPLKMNPISPLQAALDKDVKKREEEEQMLKDAAKDPDLFPEVAAKIEAAEPVQYAQIQDVGQQLTDDARRIKAALDQEPKIVFHIPLGLGEKDGAVEYACINGYRFMIRKNCPVEMPKSVYELLANHYNIQTSDPAIGQKYRLDRSDSHLQALA